MKMKRNNGLKALCLMKPGITQRNSVTSSWCHSHCPNNKLLHPRRTEGVQAKAAGLHKAAVRPFNSKGFSPPPSLRALG